VESEQTDETAGRRGRLEGEREKAMDPRQETPQSKFVAAPDLKRESAGPSDALQPQIVPASFRLNLVSNRNVIGQLGVSTGINSGWCVIVPVGQGEVLTMYYYKGNPYIRLASDSSSYMSISSGAYAGFYGWSGASSVDFTHEGWLNSSYNHQNMSFYSLSDGYLYFWNQYTVLTIVPVAA
jgi:hypothetical protein